MAKVVKKIRKPRQESKIRKSVRDRFAKRSQEVLQKAYKSKDKRSSTGGKGIFKPDCQLPIYEVKDENQLFIAPLGYEADDAFYLEVPVHYRVGPDSYICRQLFLGEPCPRCEDQQVQTRKWKEAGGKKGNYPDHLTQMFPTDRVLYLVLDVSSEEDMEKGWQIAVFPKKAVHSEIIGRTHNKRTGEFIDITDFSEGRIVYFEREHVDTERGKMPRYSSFELLPLDEDIPDEYIDSLADIIEEGKENGGTIQQFLHIPSYEEVKRSHFLGKELEAETEEEEAIATEEEIVNELDGLSKFKIKQIARDKYGVELDIKGKTADELIEEVVLAIAGGDQSEEEYPDCFGQADSHSRCVKCEVYDECVEETEQNME